MLWIGISFVFADDECENLVFTLDYITFVAFPETQCRNVVERLWIVAKHLDNIMITGTLHCSS